VDERGNERLEGGMYRVWFGVDGAAEGRAVAARLRVTGETQMVFAYEKIKRARAAAAAQSPAPLAGRKAHRVD
jgi:hypothetical protein